MFKKAATELLSSRKDDVQSVLLASLHGGKNEDTVQILRTFPYFNGWSQESLKQCCILAYVKRYLPATVIADYNDMNHGYTYFVIDGVCSVVQKVTLKIRTGFGGRKLFAIRDSLVNSENSNQHDVIFIKIRYFGSGDCFGLGEDLTNKWIISDTAVRCLVIPRDFLLQHNRNNIWPRVLQKITATFPSDSRIYASLLQQVEWHRYKKELVHYLRRRKNLDNPSTLDCVPYHWKICVDVPECLL